MSSWLLRPYPHRTCRVDEFKEARMVAVGWPSIGAVAGCEPDEVQEQLAAAYPKEKPTWLTNARNDLVALAEGMQVGDLVLVVPKRDDYKGRVLLARVAGDYHFESKFATESMGYPHQRDVVWLRTMIDRSQLPDELTPLLGRRGTTVLELPEGVLETHATERGWVS